MSISSAQSGQVWSPSSLIVVLMDEKTPGPEQIRLVLHTIIKLSYQKPQIFDRTRNTSEIEVSLNIAQFLINQSSNLNISTDTRNTSGVGRGVKNPILALNFSPSTILPISPSWTLPPYSRSALQSNSENENLAQKRERITCLLCMWWSIYQSDSDSNRGRQRGSGREVAGGERRGQGAAMRKEGFAGGGGQSKRPLPREGAVRDKDGNKHTAK